MTGFLSDLRAKTERVRDWYRNLYEGKPAHDAGKMTKKEKKMFESCERWHRNSHISEDEWMKTFETVKCDLDVAGRMDIDPVLETFMCNKKSKSNLKDKFSPTEMLDNLDAEIRNLYNLKLDDQMEEFDERFAMTGADQNFYVNVFFPTAMLKTYSKVHELTPISECLEDLFTLGAGSETDDLFPEVHGICEECVGDFIDGDTSSAEVIYLNIKVLKGQMDDGFRDPKLVRMWNDFVGESKNTPKPDNVEKMQKVKHLHQTGDNLQAGLTKFHDIEFIKSTKDNGSQNEQDCNVEDEKTEEITEPNTNEVLVYNPFAKNLLKGLTVYNPFVKKNCTSELEVRKEVNHAYSCKVCGKQFTEEEFVEMHTKLFHEGSRNLGSENPSGIVQLKYIDSCDTMITSFHFPRELEYKSSRVGNKRKNKKS